jgi:hypothetical protein
MNMLRTLCVSRLSVFGAACRPCGWRSLLLHHAPATGVPRLASAPHLPFRPVGAQVFVRVLRSGVSGKDLNSSFEFRDSVDYKLELANTIINFVKVVRGSFLGVWRGGAVPATQWLLQARPVIASLFLRPCLCLCSWLWLRRCLRAGP